MKAVQARVGRLICLLILLPTLVLSFAIARDHGRWLSRELERREEPSDVAVAREIVGLPYDSADRQRYTVYVDPRAFYVFPLLLLVQAWVVASRLHDLGVSGWWAGVLLGAPLLLFQVHLLLGLPLVVIELVMLGLLPGELYPNRWGPPPRLVPGPGDSLPDAAP